MSASAKKIMFSLPGELLKEIDAVAAEEHRSRSELIREATRHYITERPGQRRRPIDDPRVREAVASMDQLARKVHGDWNAVQVVREQRNSRYGSTGKMPGGESTGKEPGGE